MSNTETAFDSELQEYLATKVQRSRLLPRALLVGLVSGLIASAFRISLQAAESSRKLLESLFQNSAWMIPIAAGLLATVGTYLSLLIGSIDKDSGGSGIPHMKAVLEGHSKAKWRTLIPVKFAGAVMAIGTGLALGREGPTVQMGGAVGTSVADLTKASPRERKALIAAGAGSGLAAAFNAPLAGVTFVLEELQRDFQPAVFAASLLCAAVATAVSRLISGQFPAFSVPNITTPSLTFLPLFGLIGVAAGFGGVAFNKALLFASSSLSKIRQKSALHVALIVGIVICIAYSISPLLLGGGHNLTEATFSAPITLGMACLFFIVRFIVIHISYGTGVPGGIFAPLLSLGAIVGLISYEISIQFFQTVPSAPAFAVAGMCAFFTSVVRAPLTGVILIAEMTGGYEMLLPLLTAAYASYAIAESLKDMPIYEALLQRDAKAKNWNLHESELITAEYEVTSDSDYAGKRLRDLKLPPGVLIVLCRREGHEFVPNAETILLPSTRILVATGSIKGIEALENGIRS